MNVRTLPMLFVPVLLSCSPAASDADGVDPMSGVLEGPPPIDLVVPEQVEVAVFGLG